MSEKENKAIHPENPEKLKDIKLGKVYKTAAGFEAVASTAKHILEEMNVSRGFIALQKLNQVDGYDCPGCAWPDPDDHRSSIAEYCENGAKAVAEEATTKILDPAFFKKYSIAEMSDWDDYKIGKSGRIAQPMYLPKNGTHYQPLAWDEAFKILATHLNGLETPDEAIFYTSGRTSNEAAFLYQLFARAFGTNNLPDCSNMCHESSGVALGEQLGIGKGSVKLEDLYEAEVIFILGQNPGTNHPRMLSALEKAHKNGACIIAVNPLPETGLSAFADPQSVSGMLGIGTTISNIHLPVKINGDMALFQAINKLLILEEEKEPGKILDKKFIAEDTHGFGEYKNHLMQQDLDLLAGTCGIPLSKIKEVVETIKYSNKIITCWAMGLTQHKNSVDTIKELVNTLLLKGSIGKPGAGTCPVRGHSNVQGDRTMGIYEKPWDWLLENLERNFGFIPPKEYGHDVVDSIEAMHRGECKIFMGMGGNFLSATPDTQYTAKALQQCDLTVHVSTKLNRSHLVTGKEALIFPVLGRSDEDLQNGEKQFVTCENSMGVIQRSQGVLKPISEELLSEPELICKMAIAVLKENEKIPWRKYMGNYDAIRDAIEVTIPGFEDYNKRVRNYGGFYLPNSAREGYFPTETNKANFSITHISPFHIKENELLMITIRSHDQYNTTIYGLNDRYRGIKNERRVILMNREDMDAHNLKHLEQVDLFNFSDGRERVARNFLVIEYDIPKQCVATYFPETNVLVPIKSVAEKSNTPTSKSVIIEVRKHSK
ncbi:FdhF/YdeP family oxidoreductase [Aequorivita echinoideorum]|uniref:FdhF/YdeP family oxidoreductase n=1 Tax=Aequorivita echinoideorum TaxID=1549647 RepID=A0ABS5S0J0_9FLAO|nr:FdhF/YdeP family oxidoreductase [Aequorivita echinoideorum]MBT0606722.1 FdhF/YdeP family oxidoreductase [Aequorivita echinoideorum]